MAFDAALSLRIVNNQRLMAAQHLGEYRELGGALALVSDLAVDGWNCLEAFSARDREVEALLDLGFALLRAFDRDPAVNLTPLDRPSSLPRRLRTRGLVEGTADVSMVFSGDARNIAVNGELTVAEVTPEQMEAFAETRFRAFGYPQWMKAYLRRTVVANGLDPRQAFYLGSLAGEPVATAFTVREDATAGIYALGTVKQHRCQGVASTMIARAIHDALRDGCDVVTVQVDAGSDALRLCSRLGFQVAHEARWWVTRQAHSAA